MPTYQARFVRRAQPGRLVLTPRDEEVLLTCYSYRWLTRAQLQQLVPLGCVTRANDRLRRLYDNHLLGRVAAGTVGSGLQPVYVTGEAAVPLLARHLEHPEATVRERLREDLRASAVLLPHDLLCNDVRIALSRAIRQNPRAALEAWLNAAECYDTYASRRSLRPDGYFRFLAGNTLYANFLEVDRGSVSLARWKDKCARYGEYRDSDAYTGRYGGSRFRVLVAAPSAERLESLLAATRETGERGFWFALTENVLQLTDLTTPIWQTTGGNVCRGLISDRGGD